MFILFTVLEDLQGRGVGDVDCGWSGSDWTLLTYKLEYCAT